MAGDVTPCKFCHRVFHAECSQNVQHKQAVFQCVVRQNQIAYVSTANDSVVNISIVNDSTNESTSNSNIVSDEDKESSKIDESMNNNMKLELETKIGDDGVRSDFVYDETICSICNLHRLEETCELTKEELNHLLSFILHRIRSWVILSCNNYRRCMLKSENIELKLNCNKIQHNFIH